MHFPRNLLMPHDFPTKGVSGWGNFPGNTFRNRENSSSDFHSLSVTNG